MLASLSPNSQTMDQAVKDLLGHRARASHTRYSSVSFSQCSDSPSIYSRADFSPGALYVPEADWPGHSGRPMSVSSQDPSIFDDPEEASSLTNSEQCPLAADEDGGKLFIPAPTPEPAFSHGVDPASESPDTDEADEDPRMSMLGPKMRFVSRAPWEIGGDDLVEEDEEDPGGAADTPSIFGGKMGHQRSRDQDKSSAKGLALPASGGRSPAAHATMKKSGFGINFSLYRPKTPEPHSEGPYGPYISGASQSHNDIPNPLVSSSRSSYSVSDCQSSENLSHRRHFPCSGHTSPAPLGSPLPPLPSPYSFRTQNASCSSHDDSSFQSDSPPPSARYVHPYANPDLLPPPGPPPSAPLPRTPRKSRDQSSEERDRLISPLRCASESPLSSPGPLTLRKTSADGLSLPVPPSRAASNGDEDTENLPPSPFLRVRASTTPMPSSPVRSLMTYGDQPGSPMRNLITLEQARARAQNAPHSPTQPQSESNVMTSAASSTLVAGLGLAPGVVVDDSVIRGQTQRSRLISDTMSKPPLFAQNQNPQSRSGTPSSGKHMFRGLDGDIVPAARALKHKKSAFMKLFHGGKDKERDKEHLKESISLVPQAPIRAVSTTPPRNHPTDPSVRHIKRIPPPLPLSVVITSPSILGSDSPSCPAAGSFLARPASPPRHRQASSPLPSSTNPAEPSSQEAWPVPGEHEDVQSSDSSQPPASAPPTQSTFATLSLRPVSTIFSAQFPDLLSAWPPSNPRPTLIARPSSPSPTTPNFTYSRSNSISTASDYCVTPTSVIPLPGHPVMRTLQGEDQSGVIVALQEQIINSRKTWQRQIWELEGQIKDLKAEVEELRSTNECETCGKAKRECKIRTPVAQNCSVVDRPRPRMDGTVRSVFGGGNDM